MLKYMRGEMYRLLHKKSMYIFFASLAVGYFIIIYIRSGGFTAESVVNDAINLFFYLPMLAGGFLFAAIYTDDLNAKNLISLVGFGLSKTKIVLSKLLLMTLSSTIFFGLMPLFHCAIFSMFGWTVTADAWTIIYAVSIQYLLTAIAFSVLSGIVVYGLQRTTFAVVLYILLTFGIVSGLLTTGLNTFAPGLTKYLMSSISGRIMTGIISGGALTAPIIEYIVYVAAASGLSALAFYKKEMEF